MDYSILRSKYVSETNACADTLGRLEEEKYQVIARLAELDDDYCTELEKLGIKEGGKVEVKFPEDDMSKFSAIDETIPIQGYIEEIRMFSNGNIELQVSLPGQRGQRLKRVKDFYTGVKLEWVTVLPDNYNFGEG